MTDTVNRYLIKYPHARTTTIQYLAKRDETTKRLQKEVEAVKRSSLPWWKRIWRAL